MRTATSISHIRVDGVSHAWADRPVLTDVSFVIDRADRVGLIGENGAGKSTLLGIIAGRTEPDRGSVTRPERTGILLQEVLHGPDDTVRDLFEVAIAPLRAIEAELAYAAAELGRDGGDRYARALDAAERAEVWTIDARRDTLLAGLGVGDVPLDRRLAEVSGGQRSRFALAALLLSAPDALVLDEPTNHLDDAAVSFLRQQLLGWKGPVVFASHDRAFLDEVATVLIDIDPSKDPASAVTRFGGTYTDYLASKAAERERWEARFEAETIELKDLEASLAGTARELGHGRAWSDNDKMARGLKKNTVEGQLSRRVRNVRVRIDTLEQNRLEKPSEVLSFAGIPNGSHSLEGTLLELSGARIPGRLDVDALRVTATSRLLITGRNGAGKSTLLSVLAGRLSAGELKRTTGLRTALLAQDVRWRDPSLSSRTIYERAIGERRAESVPLLDLGLLTSRDLDRPAGELSEGQQRRLALAVIIARPPHLFLLDEPTNHLSLALASELEEAIGSYPGAVIVASHDRWLRRRWSGPHREMAEGRFVTESERVRHGG